jgi:hypothetical protein
MNDRLSIAVQILNGICAGDWRFEIKTPDEWDEKAVERAYYLADKMIELAEVPSKPAKKTKALKVVKE